MGVEERVRSQIRNAMGARGLEAVEQVVQAQAALGNGHELLIQNQNALVESLNAAHERFERVEAAITAITAIVARLDAPSMWQRVRHFYRR